MLEYCARGGLQAVLDEYAHVLVEYLGASGHSVEKIERDVSTGMQDALTLRSANVLADSVDIDGLAISQEARRSGFALDSRCDTADAHGKAARSNARATCRKRSTRPSGRSCSARPRSGRRAWTSTCTATR